MANFNPTTTTTKITYANAQARGQLRLWKAGLARQYRQFDNAYQSGAWRPIVDNFIKRGSDVGRRRAFAKLAQMFGTGAILEGLRLDGSPLAIWSLLKPRQSVTVDAEPESGWSQNCVTVNYVLAGAWPAWSRGMMGGVSEGLWSLEVPDHALGRAVERSGMLPDAIIRDAHHNLLQLQGRQIKPDGAACRKFLVRAGGGGFVCELTCATDVSLGNELACRVFAHTWLAADQLRDDQTLLADDGGTGERLGDTWLMPAPLRRLWMNSSGQVECAVAVATMPTLLGAPQGRA